MNEPSLKEKIEFLEGLKSLPDNYRDYLETFPSIPKYLSLDETLIVELLYDKYYTYFPLEANLSTQEYVRQYIKANHLIPDPCDHQFELCFDKEFAQCSKCGLVVKSFSLEGS